MFAIAKLHWQFLFITTIPIHFAVTISLYEVLRQIVEYIAVIGLPKITIGKSVANPNISHGLPHMIHPLQTLKLDRR